ncbi:hypothetical protein [Thalassotalea agarivorans]|uniref:Uncharacterized protein n=1 Tax=Thalassotalea agarivorans TaxID=349064 RepID=A0A1I0GFU7_THASX|nr:hypothetical protein [Thalassotalea agarivorans]SET68897.1 hypothetical protein SAMN05660429_02420 [Thalassotalea agarivorans]
MELAIKMTLKGRFFGAVAVGVSTYLAFLVVGQIDLASDLMATLKSCEQELLSDCVRSQESTRLVSRWDGNLKFYWVLSVLCVLVVGYISPKPSKK